MTEPPMVEWASRAMAFNWPAPAWTDEFSEDRRNYWRAKARAAFATLRAPTPEVLRALYGAFCDMGPLSEESYAMAAWQAAIDAALAPAPEGTDEPR